MRADKRKRLQARRWKVGNVQEFLGLTDQDQEAAYIELLRLVKGLEARRNARGLSQIELAKAVQSSQLRVAKMEAGVRFVPQVSPWFTMDRTGTRLRIE
jgi:hypothetical protein